MGGGGARAGESGGKKAAEERKKISPRKRREERRVARRVVGRMDALNRLEIFASQGLPRCAGKHGWRGRGSMEVVD